MEMNGEAVAFVAAHDADADAVWRVPAVAHAPSGSIRTTDLVGHRL